MPCYAQHHTDPQQMFDTRKLAEQPTSAADIPAAIGV